RGLRAAGVMYGRPSAARNRSAALACHCGNCPGSFGTSNAGLCSPKSLDRCSISENCAGCAHSTTGQRIMTQRIGSPGQLQHELRDPGIAGAADAAEGRILQADRRSAELRMVERVEGFVAELRPHSFPHLEALVDPQIPIVEPRTEQNIAPGVA